ncbi:MAG: hypothetical protein PWP31_892 [Clostridia bacterium]|nr:hypothetical protein [Clostridia bacterium]
MPRGDRTGPWGLGPRTGRGAGFCNGFPTPGYANPGFGPGFGRGRGMGRRMFGFGNMLPAGWWGIPFPGAVPPQGQGKQNVDLEVLKQQADMLEKQLNGIKQQLKEMENEEDQ